MEKQSVRYVRGLQSETYLPGGLVVFSLFTRKPERKDRSVPAMHASEFNTPGLFVGTDGDVGKVARNYSIDDLKFRPLAGFRTFAGLEVADNYLKDVITGSQPLVQS